MSSLKMHLGDGAYVDLDIDGRSIVLTAENGYRATDTVVLGPREINVLQLWIIRVMEMSREQLEPCFTPGVPRGTSQPGPGSDAPKGSPTGDVDGL